MEKIKAPTGVTLYDPEDVDSYRERLFSGVMEETAALFPYVENGVRVELGKLHYDRQDGFSPQEEQKARDEGRSLHYRLRGEVKLVDEKTRQPIEAKEVTLAQVPWVTKRGTVLLDGREIASTNQLRLLPGAYTRRRETGDLETHFNPKAGTSRSQFRVALEPATGVFRLQLGSKANLHLHSLLMQLGVPEKDLRAEWGDELYAVNAARHDPRTLDRAYTVLVADWDKKPGADVTAKAEAVKAALERAKISKFVAETNLPEMLMRKRAGWKPSRILPSQTFRPQLTFEKAASCVWWLYGLPCPALEFQLGAERFVKAAAQAGDGAYEFLAAYQDDDNGKVQRMWREMVAQVAPKVAAYDPRAAWVMTSYMTDPLRRVADPDRLERAMERYREAEGGLEKLAETLEDRRQTAREATKAPVSPEQAKAGNYPKGRFTLRGLPITIETAVGQVRRGVDPSGKPWSVKMRDDYGYIRRTTSEADGDHIDVFLGPDLGSDKVFVIDQNKNSGGFDEHKCMVGYNSKEEAREAYCRNFTDNRNAGPTEEMSFRQFRWWVMYGETDCPVSEQNLFRKVSSYVPEAVPVLTVKEALAKTIDSAEEEQSASDEEFPPWYGFDLDGTLAEAGDDFDPDSVGTPVESILTLVRRLREKGKTVKIFTARAADPKNLPVIKSWLEELDLGDVEITNIKDPGMVLLVDDRAYAVTKNEGLTPEAVESIVKAAMAAESDYWSNYSDEDV